MINLLLPSAEVKSCIWLNQTLPSPLDLLYPFFFFFLNLFPFSLAAAGHERRTRRRREKGAQESGDRCSTLCLVRHTPLSPSRCCIPVQTVTCRLVLHFPGLPCTHVLQKHEFPDFCKGGRSSRGGNLGVEVLSVVVGGAGNHFLRVRADYCLLCDVNKAEQSGCVASKHNTPLHTQAQTCSAVMCAKQSYMREGEKTHSLLSVCLPPFLLFFPFQIPTTAVPTHGKWMPNISCSFKQM